mgnify:FL=1
MAQVDIAELLELALEDERAGAAFYEVMARRAGRERLRQVFAELAEQERFHEGRFREMLESVGGQAAPGAAPPARSGYLQALALMRAFPDEAQARRQAEGCGSDGLAVEMAVRFERDTLLLMREIALLVPVEYRDIVRELILEEESHVVTLAAVRREL